MKELIMPYKLFSKKEEKSDISLKELFCDVEKIVSGYSAINGYKIHFKQFVDITNIELPFQQIVFNQLIISLILNILTFIKSKKQEHHINIIINSDKIIITFDTFALDYDTLLYYTEKVFEETTDPFCLSLNEVFSFLEESKIKCKLSYEAGENIIKILLPNKNKEHGKILRFIQKK
jgi:hypothetical protein